MKTIKAFALLYTLVIGYKTTIAGSDPDALISRDGNPNYGGLDACGISDDDSCILGLTRITTSCASAQL